MDLDQLRQAIADGLQSLERGEGVDGDEFFAQLEREEAKLLERNHDHPESDERGS